MVASAAKKPKEDPTSAEDVAGRFEQVRDLLSRHLLRLASVEDSLGGTGNFERRMATTAKVLQLLPDPSGGLTAKLEAMRDFAAFCVQNVGEEEFKPLRKFIIEFVDDLRRRSL